MTYLFGDCEIDTVRYELRRAGAPVRVEPQVIDLLLHLVRNPERLVTKEEIFATIWKGRVVSESALSARMSAVRRAIGDSARDDGLIRTIFRRGFRFMGAVTVIDSPGRAAPAPSPLQIASAPAAPPAAAALDEVPSHLPGVFACYSHAFAPAFDGRLIRSSLVIEQAPSGHGLSATYSERLSNLTLRHRGAVRFSERIAYLDLVDAQADSRVHLTLRFPSAPASALIGVMSGKVFHHANMEVAVTRFVAVRVPVDPAELHASNRYFDPVEHPLSDDLAALGRPIASRTELDRVLHDVLNRGASAGYFRVTASDALALNVALDRSRESTAAG